MYALVRTDTGVKKQAGISYLLFDMKTPGVQGRPVVTLDGHPYTNETFLDNVKVPVKHLVGEENKGWNYAKFLLGNERAGIARVGLTKARVRLAKALAERVYVDGAPMSENRQFREKLAAIEVELKALEITNMMVVAGMKKGGAKHDPRTSVLKIKGSEVQQASLECQMELAGPDAMARQVGFMEAKVADAIGREGMANSAPNYYFSRVLSIYGGSNEIQRNIIAKAVLGL